MAKTMHPLSLFPPHEVRDAGKLAALTASMEAAGWDGAPVVAILANYRAVTGSHRLAAAAAAGIDVPVVDLEDLLDDAGTSLDDLVDEYGDEYEAIVRLAYHLPAEVVDAYGIDMH